MGNIVSFPVCFEFIAISIGQFGVGIFFGGEERIGGFLGEFDSSGTEERDDRVSDRSLSPERCSRVGDIETIIRRWVGSCFNHGDIETFRYISKVGYSGTITGSARVSIETYESYGSEYGKYSDDDDEFDESEGRGTLLGLYDRFLVCVHRVSVSEIRIYVVVGGDRS